ncbi:MAG TPA: hypothetical protein VMZ26_12570 [Pyrinomonadaceae bacterium]|nr:hypothetical protein [Pyrinomonadaceae bacterium]
MKNIGLVLVFLLLSGLACGKFGASKSTSTSPLTVGELGALKDKNPTELAAKYNGKKVIVVGEVLQVPFTYPGAYETFGYQSILLTDHHGSAVDCQVTEAEAAKFKDLKIDDVVTVTGTFKYEKSTMDIEGCSKATADNIK